MKYYTPASVVVLAGLSNARPMPQFGLPSLGLPGFSIPSIPMPTNGLGFPSLSLPAPTGGAGLGSGFSIPSFGGSPAPTGGLGSGGLTLPTGVADLPSTVQATATEVAAEPTSTGSTGGGSVGSDCTAQGSGGGSTENGVADKNCCTDVTVVFARGTGETGNVGTISGPPTFKSLREKLGADKVTIQGVDYPADAAVSLQIRST